MLQTAAPRGQQGLLPALRHLCSSPAFVPGPCPFSQPTGPVPHCWPGCSPLPAVPLPGLSLTQMPDPILGQWWGGSAQPAQPPSRAACPLQPASHPSLSCPRPLTCSVSAPLTISPLWVWPLTTLPPPPIPLFLALQSLGVRLSLSHAFSAPPSPLSSSPISPPPASTPSPAHSPSPSPAAPLSSPTSLFQLRTGSSGQFPHRSASGEETAPPR